MATLINIGLVTHPQKTEGRERGKKREEKDRNVEKHATPDQTGPDQRRQQHTEASRSKTHSYVHVTSCIVQP